MKIVLVGFAAASLAPCGGADCQSFAGAGVTSPGPRQAPPAANAFDVDGARLGMTLRAWETLAGKSGTTSHVMTSCTIASGPRGGFSKVRALDRPGVIICSYVARYGQTVLQQSFPLTATFYARAPSYYFIDGRLSRIEFHTSVNAFNNLDALFTAKFGAPVETLRDNLDMGRGLSIPRVRREWRNAREDLWIVDPSARLDELIVRYSSADAGRSLPNS